MNLKIIKTTSDNLDFHNLVYELDVHLTEFYGNKVKFFEKHNTVENIKNVILLFDGKNPIGCGGIKKYSNTVMEVKRMYVKPDYRGQGIASQILTSLENWALELGYSSTILETMKVKESVIKLYEKNGYKIIPNYGQYENVDESICMQKVLNLKTV